jgi:hypothetical protein
LCLEFGHMRGRTAKGNPVVKLGRSMLRPYRIVGQFPVRPFLGTNPTGELITSGLPVIRPGSMLSAEITSDKPTSRY